MPEQYYFATGPEIAPIALAFWNFGLKQISNCWPEDRLKRFLTRVRVRRRIAHIVSGIPLDNVIIRQRLAQQMLHSKRFLDGPPKFGVAARR